MATIYLTLSTKADKITNKTEILIRFKHGVIDLRAKGGIYVDPKHWSQSDQKVVVPNSRIRTPLQVELSTIDSKVSDLCCIIMGDFLDRDKSTITKGWLEQVIDHYHHPDKFEPSAPGQTFFDMFAEFLAKHKLSEQRIRAYMVVVRVLKRYELYKRLSTKTQFNLEIDTITPLVLQEFEEFLRSEYVICNRYPDLYKEVPDSRAPQERGQNTINNMLTKLRSFFIWANNNEKTTNNPFRRYKINECVYGTPYYITIAERNRIFNTNLSRHPQLAIQRDIFVFQCLIGCRIGDLWAMTKNNVMSGAIEYIPRKTKEGRPVNIRVPLSATAKIILERYADYGRISILPFISEQKYNVAIKRIFRAARLNRMVTVVNPTTRMEEKRRLCEIASSHLARRTFIGNLYKQVKDPNLVGALSGHKEGSKAFARYRDIDEDMKIDLVSLLE